MWILRRKGGVTARNLARLIGCRASKKYLPKRKDFIINYGVDYPHANLNANVVFNKMEVHKKLQENDIPVPRIFMKGESIPSDAFPLLARKRFHSKGRDIIYIHNREQLISTPSFKYDFLTEYINKRSEYRVHILGDYTTIVNVKFKESENADPIVRSKDNKWRQISYNGEFMEDLIALAKKAITILKYDFGVVDIIRKKDKLYVLEVNSNPGLEERKLQIYADYFKSEERKWRIR